MTREMELRIRRGGVRIAEAARDLFEEYRYLEGVERGNDTHNTAPSVEVENLYLGGQPKVVIEQNGYKIYICTRGQLERLMSELQDVAPNLPTQVARKKKRAAKKRPAKRPKGSR